MSFPNKPAGGNAPPPIDPDKVQEIPVDEILSVELGGGFCTIVFGKRRMVEGTNGKPPKLQRIVKSRIVLSHAALDDMMTKLIGLNQASQQANLLAAAKKQGPSN